MPLNKSMSKKEMFHEFGRGKTYAATKKKFGRKKADKQRIAVVLKNKRESAHGKKRKSGRKPSR